MDVQALIIGWHGLNERARNLAAALEPSVERVSVVYSSRNRADETGPGTWLRVPDDDFFGRKFVAGIARFDGDILLLVQADAACDDWPGLVARLREAAADIPNLGVWAPTINYTPWTLSKVTLRPAGLAGLVHATQTDAIVAAFTRPVTARLRKMDYSVNNIGWGIDWAAISYSYAHALAVVRDRTVFVSHPPARGYNDEPARAMENAFLAQLTEAESCQYLMLRAALRSPVHRLRKPAPLRALGRFLRPELSLRPRES